MISFRRCDGRISGILEHEQEHEHEHEQEHEHELSTSVTGLNEPLVKMRLVCEQGRTSVSAARLSSPKSYSLTT
jgi:hypothetical protein